MTSNHAPLAKDDDNESREPLAGQRAERKAWTDDIKRSMDAAWEPLFRDIRILRERNVLARIAMRARKERTQEMFRQDRLRAAADYCREPTPGGSAI